MSCVWWQTQQDGGKAPCRSLWMAENVQQSGCQVGLARRDGLRLFSLKCTTSSVSWPRVEAELAAYIVSRMPARGSGRCWAEWGGCLLIRVTHAVGTLTALCFQSYEVLDVAVKSTVSARNQKPTVGGSSVTCIVLKARTYSVRHKM